MRGAPPDYQRAIDYLYRFVGHTGHTRWAGYEGAPRRVRAFLHDLGDPDASFQSVVVAGTKGKGSTAAMLEAIFRASGYRVGLYTSPHLHSFRERIQVQRRLITQAEFVALVDELRPAIETWIRSHDRDDWPTTFELATVMAMVHFARQGVDAAVLEVGRGGRFDAVNAVLHNLAVMTSISMDHANVLGGTLTAIAREKSGVIPTGGTFVLGPQRPEVVEVLEEACREQGAVWWFAGERGLEVRDFSSDPSACCGAVRAVPYPVDPTSVRLSLAGGFQQGNLRLALGTAAALRAAGWQLPEHSIVEGLERVRWPGRFEVVHPRPLTLVDGAHNAESARRLREAMNAAYPGRPVVWVVGFSSGKDMVGVLAALYGGGDALILTRSHHPRAVPTSVAADAARLAGFAPTLEAPTVPAAWEAAAGMAQGQAVVCFTGSLFVVAEAREQFGLAEEVD